MPGTVSLTKPKPSDPAVLTIVEDAIAQGDTIPTVAQALGAGIQTLYDWLKHAQAEVDGEAPLPELGSCRAFREAVERGVARFEQARLENIRGAEKPIAGGWQPSAWLLERSPWTKERWSQQREARVTAASHQTLVLILPPEAATALASYLASGGGGGLPLLTQGAATEPPVSTIETS